METTGTILIVEDDVNDQFLLERGFWRAGIQNSLRIVGNAFEAMDYLVGTGEFANREVFPLPGLVVTDYEMPVRNGVQLLRWIREESGLEIPVIVVIGSGWERRLHLAYEAGAIHATHKTGDYTGLAEELMGAWRRWLERPSVRPGEGEISHKRAQRT